MEWQNKRNGGYSLEYEGHKIEIMPDENGGEVVKDCDRACTLLFFGRNAPALWPAQKGYGLGLSYQDHANCEDDFNTALDTYVEDGQLTRKERRGIIYEVMHIGDGVAALAYMTREDRVKEWGRSIIKARRYMQAVLKELRQVWEGDVWGFSISGPVCDDSCWGFVGLEDVKAEALASLKASLEWEKKEAARVAACVRL